MLAAAMTTCTRPGTRVAFRRVGRAFLLATSLAAQGCFAFHLVGPDQPAPVQTPGLVQVSVVYQQPVGCYGPAERCDERVIFYGNWMQNGGEFALVRDPYNHLWRGTAYAVPVNFPPTGYPHEVRVFDPHMLDYPTQGMTAERLWIGEELVTQFVYPDNPNVYGQIYVDQNAHGRTPF